VSSPLSSHLFGGLSFAFSTSAEHPLAKNAIVNPATALNVNFQTSKDSTSTKIAFIRRLLKGEVDESNEITDIMKKVAKGEVRLVVEVTKADIMAALIRMKRDVAPEMKMTFVGGHESWMVSIFFPSCARPNVRLRTIWQKKTSASSYLHLDPSRLTGIPTESSQVHPSQTIPYHPT